MKKICFVVTVPVTIKSFFVDQISFLAKNGYSVTVICLKAEELSCLFKSGVKFISVKIPFIFDVSIFFKIILNVLKRNGVVDSPIEAVEEKNEKTLDRGEVLEKSFVCCYCYISYQMFPYSLYYNAEK